MTCNYTLAHTYRPHRLNHWVHATEACAAQKNKNQQAKSGFPIAWDKVAITTGTLALGVIVGALAHHYGYADSIANYADQMTKAASLHINTANEALKELGFRANEYGERVAEQVAPYIANANEALKDIECVATDYYIQPTINSANKALQTTSKAIENLGQIISNQFSTSITFINRTLNEMEKLPSKALNLIVHLSE